MVDKRIIGKKPKIFSFSEFIKKLINIVFCIIFIPIILINLYMFIQTIINPDIIPNAFGYEFFIITSGSMEPTINTGDFIIISKIDASQLKVNDVITFKKDNSIVTHRIINMKNENGEYYFTTQGDANNVEDTNTVTPSEIIGEYNFTIPLLGKIILFVQKPEGLAIIIAIPILLTLISRKINTNKSQKEIERKNKRISYKRELRNQQTI